MAQVLYVGHSIHSGQEFDYKFANDLGQLYLKLPYFYGISLVQVDGTSRTVIATVLVKTDLGQSRDEVGDIWALVTSQKEDLNKLPKKNVTLRCTKINQENDVIPGEQDIVKLLSEVYTINGVGGTA